jgi:hypothetical protein
MRRAFDVDVLACPRCGGRLLALLEAGTARILRHMGLPAEVPTARPARRPRSSAAPHHGDPPAACPDRLSDAPRAVDHRPMPGPAGEIAILIACLFIGLEREAQAYTDPGTPPPR